MRSFIRFDRYVLSRLMSLFGLYAIGLAGVYWINQAVRLFDRIIGDGQPIGVFLEFTALTLPNVTRITLPVAAAAASLHVANRLATDSEFTIVRFSGWSRWRLMRPAIVFGIVVAALVSLLAHVIVPLSTGRLAERQNAITANVLSRLLAEGEFLHPSDGVSFYVRDITPSGELSDIFLTDTREPGLNFTYTARKALLLRHETGPRLVMFDGMLQTLSLDERRLGMTRFDEFAYDLTGMVGRIEARGRGIRELATPELLWPDEDTIGETGQPLPAMLVEGHGRVSQALLGIVAALAGFAAMMLGSFSRFGLLKQAIGAILALIGLKFIDNLLIDAAGSGAGLWPLLYLAPALGLVAVVATILLADSRKPFPFGSRVRWT